MKNGLFYPVLCSSLIFFFIAFQLGFGSLVPSVGSLWWGILPTFLGIVSLAGVYFVQRELRTQSKRWYWGIPPAIALGVVCLTGPVVILIFGRSPLDYLFLSFALLSVTSIGFFFSFLDPKKVSARILITVLGGIGVYAIISSYQVILGLLSPLRTSWSVITALEGIYLIFLMPLIGLCYGAAAFVSRE